VWRGAGALVDGTAATPIAQLAATALAEFDADATERQLLDIATGQTASLTLASGGEPIPGAVRTRSAALDPTTPTLGAFGSVTVTTRKRDGVLVVPADALRGAVSDGAEVVVCKDGKAALRTVQVGWRDDRRVEIASGLSEGERVAVDHVLGLQTDSPIVEGP
jgi:HlyD family secretion protein